MSNRFGKRRGIMSTANFVFLAAVLIVVVASAALGRWLGVVVFGLLFILQLATVLYIRANGRAGDVTRVNALEYSDERDRSIALHGLAAVGVAGLLGSAALFVWAVLAAPVGSVEYIGASLLFAALCLVWAIANWVAAIRL